MRFESEGKLSESWGFALFYCKSNSGTYSYVPSNVLSSTYFLGKTFFLSKIFLGNPP